MRIRIVLVDDHAVVRHGLRGLLEREPDMEIIGESGTGLEAIRLAAAMRPDVVLLDAKLGDIDGPDACQRILLASPATSVVVLTGYLNDTMVLTCLAAGAKAYLLKDVELAELKRTVRAVHRGESVLDPKVASRVIASATVPPHQRRRADTLSESDRAVIGHVASGRTNKQIAALVHLSPHTIKDRVEKIAAIFGVRSWPEIVAEAMRRGVL